jgi:NADH:ubiquinone oxidoreductase subunit 4 (subunit M)
MQQGMLLCLHSWGEEESLRACHKTVLFTKIVSFCFLLCDVKGLCQPKRKKTTTTKAHFYTRSQGQ